MSILLLSWYININSSVKIFPDPGVSKIFQDPGFSKIFQDPGFSKIFPDPGFPKIFQDPGIFKIFQDPGLKKKHFFVPVCTCVHFLYLSVHIVRTSQNSSEFK